MNWLNLSGRQNNLDSEKHFTWPEMTPQDWLMEAVSVVGLVSMFAFIVYYFPKLPRMIPVQYDAEGFPRGLGSRYQIWIIPAITLFIHLVLPLKERLSPFIRRSRFLKRVNTQTQFNARVRLIRYNKMVVTWGLFYISISTVRIALHAGNGVAGWFPWVFLILLITPLLFYRFYIK